MTMSLQITSTLITYLALKVLFGFMITKSVESIKICSFDQILGSSYSLSGILLANMVAFARRVNFD
jgi:hypothetical protein